jgi:hypothetical protein
LFSRRIRESRNRMYPSWLTALSILSLAAGVGAALWLVTDLWRFPQKMAVMNAVWPLTALFGSGLLVWFYLRHGRADRKDRPEAPFPIAVAKGALHCGAGCTLGDILAESLALAVPAILFAFGYGSLFANRIFAAWGLDFVAAFLIGIMFQYFAIAPMRDLGLRSGIVAAVKADALSLSAWQVGMYGFMAIAHFVLFGALLNLPLPASRPEFWFMMQIAMLAGFATAYPVNWALIRMGIKERM